MVTPGSTIGPAQLQAIGQQLETRIHAAKNLLVDLEQRFAHLNPEGGGLTRDADLTPVSVATAHVQDGLQQLTQRLSETATHSQQVLTELGSSYAQFNQQVHIGEQELQGCQQTLHSQGEQTTALLVQFLQTLQNLQNLFEQNAQTYQATEQHITQLHQTGAQTFGVVESALHGFEQSAVQQRRTELESAAQQMQEQLQNLGQQRVQEFVQTTQSQVDTVQTYFSQTSQQLGQTAQSAVEQLLQAAGTFAQQEGQQRLHDLVEQLVQGAVAHLGEEIALSIVETQAGAAISGALAPVMPKLIVVYKATEAIEDAIHVFKEVKNTLGGIGNAFGIS